MRNLIIIILIIAIVIFEFFMFQFSVEIGAVSLVLFSATFCIGFVLNKITTVVDHASLALSSKPFRDSSKNSGNKNKSERDIKYDSDNLIPGVDSSIFEQFRKKFNLKKPEQVDEDYRLAELNSTNSISATQAYEKAGVSEEPENFDEELEDADQVKVTLSENVKILKELQGEKTDEESNENFIEDPKIPMSSKIENKNKLGSGEEALELLTKKHQALKKQNNEESLEIQVEGGDDLFDDEFVPLPGGEDLIEEDKEEFFEEDIFFPTKKEHELHEDEEELELSLRQTNTHREKSDEAEGLLKLATTACEAGRMEEAKAGLKTYFKLLYELGKSPSKNVLQLAEKLEVDFDTAFGKTSIPLTEEKINSSDSKSEKDIQKFSEKTDYSAVMDSIVKSLEKKEAYDEALPLLKDLLKFNRERVNISAMDPIFERIEQAHSSMKNYKELVDTYKEHLAIKQQLNDKDGELQLLDLIGNHYANSGDQKASERYLAESQRIRGELNKK